MSPLAELAATLAPIGALAVAAVRYIAGRVEASGLEKKAEIIELKTLLADRDATIAGLGRKRDGDREMHRREVEALKVAHANHVRKVVIAISKRSTPTQAARGASQWEELPTDVRDTLDLVALALAPAEDPFRDLENWDPNQSTPPGSSEPPQPRKLFPSRPR